MNGGMLVQLIPSCGFIKNQIVDKPRQVGLISIHLRQLG